MSLRKQSHEHTHRVDLCPNRSIMSPALVREKEDGLREGWREGNRQRQRDTERDHGLVPNRCETPAGITLN